MRKVCIIGGCGHVGIPLGRAFVSKNFDVTLVVVNPQAVENINRAHLPFRTCRSRKTARRSCRRRT